MVEMVRMEAHMETLTTHALTTQLAPIVQASIVPNVTVRTVVVFRDIIDFLTTKIHVRNTTMSSSQAS